MNAFFRPALLDAVLLVQVGTAAAQVIPWSTPPTVVTGERVVWSGGGMGRHGVPRKPRRVEVRSSDPAKAERVESALAPLAPERLEAVREFLALTGSPTSAVLSTFDGSAGSGSVRAATSWIGNITQNAGSITVAGTALNDNGWGATGLSLDASAMNLLTITAQRGVGNAAPSLFVQFEDRSLHTQFFSVSTSLFAIGTPTTVQVPIGPWTIDFGANDITGWSIGGGGVGTVALQMTFDHLELSVSAIPEPAAVGWLAGVAVLGFAWQRRRSR